MKMWKGSYIFFLMFLFMSMFFGSISSFLVVLMSLKNFGVIFVFFEVFVLFLFFVLGMNIGFFIVMSLVMKVDYVMIWNMFEWMSMLVY